MKRLEPAFHFLLRIRDEEAVWGELTRIAARQQQEGADGRRVKEAGVFRDVSGWAQLVCHPDPGLSALAHRVTER